MKRSELEQILISDFGYMSIDRQTEILKKGSLEPVKQQEGFLGRLCRTKGIENALEMQKEIYIIGESGYSTEGYRTLREGDVEVFQTSAKIDPNLYKAIVKSLQKELGLKECLCGKQEIEPVLMLAQTKLEPTNKTYEKRIVGAIKKYGTELADKGIMPPTGYRKFKIEDVEKIRTYIK